jgi:hypothetical protein
MSGPTFKVGELVDIRIKGARYAAEHGDNSGFDLVGEPDRIWLPLSDASITVDRVAPAEWPPRAGDIWADRNGKEWFAVRRISITGDAIIFRAADDDASNWNEPSEVLSDVGPLALIRRRRPVQQ